MSQSAIVTSCWLTSWHLEVAVAKCHSNSKRHAIDWAQVMTKILVSCAVGPLCENVEFRSREKEIFFLFLFLEPNLSTFAKMWFL